MFFDSLGAFLDMGGHGFYVWLSYLIGLVLIVYNVVIPLLGKKRFIKEQARRLRRERQLAEKKRDETA